jgi:tetratricopeptide (TPR) repeat protein
MHDESVHREARSLLERLVRTQAALDRERAEAPSLCARLFDLPPREQAEGLRMEPRLHTWGVCEVLLEKSLAAAEADAAESGRLASLVLTAASLLDEALHVAPVVQDLESRAWACLGEARLRAGDLGGAEEALREGAARLAHGTGDLLVEARLLEFEATVRRQQGRTSEAAALLKQAESRYREANEHHLAARTHHKRDQVLQQADTLLRNIVFEPTS